MHHNIFLFWKQEKFGYDTYICLALGPMGPKMPNQMAKFAWPGIYGYWNCVARVIIWSNIPLCHDHFHLPSVQTWCRFLRLIFVKKYFSFLRFNLDELPDIEWNNMKAQIEFALKNLKLTFLWPICMQNFMNWMVITVSLIKINMTYFSEISSIKFHKQSL